jgi:hypothetical protein
MSNFNSMVDSEHWAKKVDVIMGRNLKKSIEGKSIDFSQIKTV